MQALLMTLLLKLLSVYTLARICMDNPDFLTNENKRYVLKLNIKYSYRDI